MAMPGALLLFQEPSDLSFICIDYRTSLYFGDVQVVWGSPFKLSIDHVEWHLDPERRDELGPFLALYPDTLSAGQAEENGTLRLAFISGAIISVPRILNTRPGRWLAPTAAKSCACQAESWPSGARHFMSLPIRRAWVPQRVTFRNPG